MIPVDAELWRELSPDGRAFRRLIIDHARRLAAMAGGPMDVAVKCCSTGKLLDTIRVRMKRPRD